MANMLIKAQARERLRVQQAEEAKAVAAYGGACTRLEAAVTRRAGVVATQDGLVATAEGKVAVAAAKVVAGSGLARAAAILDIKPAVLRHLMGVAKAHERAGR